MSESRNSSESRSTTSYVSKPTESRTSGESRYETRNERTNKYNNLEDIDSLIEKLEREMPNIKSTNPRINKVLDERHEKIEELKRLRNRIEREREEEKLIRKLEESNNELDNIINDVKKLIKEPTKEKEDYEETIRFVRDSDGESHFSAESRW